MTKLGQLVTLQMNADPNAARVRGLSAALIEQGWTPADRFKKVKGRWVLACEAGRPGIMIVKWHGGPKTGSWHDLSGTAAWGDGLFTHFMRDKDLEKALADRNEGQTPE